MALFKKKAASSRAELNSLALRSVICPRTQSLVGECFFLFPPEKTSRQLLGNSKNCRTSMKGVI